MNWSSMCMSNRSNGLSNCNRNCCLTYRIHITILVKILRKAFQCNGCQSSRSLDQVTIGRGEGARLWPLVDKTSVGEGHSHGCKTRQDKLGIIRGENKEKCIKMIT